jgi:hypothetical protein
MEAQPGELSEIYQKENIPVLCEATLYGHAKSVTCIAIEKNGARMATGSWDFDVK